MRNIERNFETSHVKVARNAIYLYIRMIVILLMQLYTSRIILDKLGVVDYGLYNVIGGMVTMFAFLNNSMQTTTQRYLTFELGTGNTESLKKIFSTSLVIHASISVIVIIIAETIGLWLLFYKMVIPNERMAASFIVFQLSVITLVVNIMSSPYNADIIAHEHMKIFAIISFIESGLKLVAAFLISIGSFDRLILYSFLILLSQLLIRVIYNYYCSTHFQEAIYSLRYSKALIKEMGSFVGWNVFGSFCWVLLSQGLNILINVFFGPVVNAARALSVQVQGALSMLSNNFQLAINPQITKSYAINDKQTLHKLVYSGCKLVFLLMLVASLPVFLKTEYILGLWLKEVPEYTVVFVKLMLLISLVDSVSGPFMVCAAATGRIKKYQIAVSSCLILIVPFSYLFLKFGYSVLIIYHVNLLFAIIALGIRLFFMKQMINISLTFFLKNVLARCLFVTFASFFTSMFVVSLLNKSFVCSLFACGISIIITCVYSILLGLNKQEKILILSILKR